MVFDNFDKNKNITRDVVKIKTDSVVLKSSQVQNLIKFLNNKNFNLEQTVKFLVENAAMSKDLFSLNKYGKNLLFNPHLSILLEIFRAENNIEKSVIEYSLDYSLNCLFKIISSILQNYSLNLIKTNICIFNTMLKTNAVPDKKINNVLKYIIKKIVKIKKISDCLETLESNISSKKFDIESNTSIEEITERISSINEIFVEASSFETINIEDEADYKAIDYISEISNNKTITDKNFTKNKNLRHGNTESEIKILEKKDGMTNYKTFHNIPLVSEKESKINTLEKITIESKINTLEIIDNEGSAISKTFNNISFVLINKSDTNKTLHEIKTDLNKFFF